MDIVDRAALDWTKRRMASVVLGVTSRSTN
jgi:hypothetical protein